MKVHVFCYVGPSSPLVRMWAARPSNVSPVLCVVHGGLWIVELSRLSGDRNSYDMKSCDRKCLAGASFPKRDL